MKDDGQVGRFSQEHKASRMKMTKNVEVLYTVDIENHVNGKVRFSETSR